MASIVTIDGIPVYNAVISDSTEGMDKISLVDAPAVMSDFLKFKEAKQQVLCAISDEDKRLIYGVVMRADFPIYRNDEMGEYYIIYNADTIRQMAEKYLADGKCNNVNLMHEDGTDVEGVQMVQFFIKDSALGVAPAGFEDIADGSLFGEFHVTNDEIWNAVKEGTYKGFSLEGYFDFVPNRNTDEVADIIEGLAGAFAKMSKSHNKISIMKKIDRIKAALAKVFVEAASCTTDKGILYWDGDDELAVDAPVFSDEAKEAPAADGEYVREDGSTIVVAEGKVKEIKEKQAEPADTAAPDVTADADTQPADDTTPDDEPAEPANDNDGGSDEKDSLEKRVEALETIVAKIADWLGMIVIDGGGEQVAESFAAQMSAIKSEVEALKKSPAAQSAHAAFNAQAEVDSEKPKDRRCVTRKTL